MKKALSLIMVAVMISMSLAGCQSESAPSESEATGTPESSTAQESSEPADAESKALTVAIPSDVASLDTRNATSTVSAGVLAHMFNKLVKSDQDMSIEPDLAESYEQIDDLTWRFNLRQDVTFHDGSKFTSEDVVFTFDSLKDTDKGWGLTTDFSFMTATAVDEYTVDISTEEPYPGLLLRLNYVMIMPKDYVETVGDEEFANSPVGTGPYKFVERSKDEHIKVEAYEGFYNGAPSIPAITFRVMPEMSSRLAALESGEIQFVSAVPAIEMERLEGSGYSVADYPTSRIYYLSFNTLIESPLNDIKVRQAISHAINKEMIVEGVLDGYAVATASIACPQYDGYDESIVGYEYDVDKAKALLTEAGYPDGFEINASYSLSTPSGADVMQYIASELSNVGITVTLSETDAVNHRQTIGAGTVEPLYLNAIGGPYANIDLQAKLVFSSGERYSTYANPEFDALRLQAASTVDQAARDKLNSQLQQMIIDDAAGYSMYQSSATYAMNSALENFIPRADEMLLFYDCDYK